MALFSAIAFSVIATATLSGIFGMAGGMILIAVYLSLFPVATSMVLHGVTQVAANGFRAVLLWRHVRWRPLGWIGLGVVLSTAAFAAAQIALSRPAIMILLGALPLLAMVTPWAPRGGVDRPGIAIFCGLLSTATKLMAGVTGPLTDHFFVQSSLNRYEVIATKGLMQTVGHLVKVLYFGLLLQSGDLGGAPLALYPTVVVCALIGTRIGRVILDRLSEEQFRRGSRVLIVVLAVVLMTRGVVELVAA